MFIKQSARRKREAEEARVSLKDGQHPVYTIPRDGVYLLVVHVWSRENTDPFTASGKCAETC